MNEQISRLHRKAMTFASDAYLASLRGDVVASADLRHQAFVHERGAAMKLLNKMAAEPTRSVLFRSAATLALDVGQSREAERLVAMGLSGDPPHEIAEELRDVLERVYFDRHLAVRGVVMEPNDLQMSMSGIGVGLGAANVEDIVPRAQAVERSYHRLIERKRSKRFRPYFDRSIQRQNPVNMTIPRAASFAVSFQVGRQLDLPLPMDGNTSDMLGELLECFALYEQGDEPGLRKLIGEDSYYNNFVGLARQIAPDGANVSMVGFTFVRGGTPQVVALTKRNQGIRLIGAPIEKKPPAPGDEHRRVSVIGTLRFANDESKKSIIRIVEQTTGVKHPVIVPPGTMNDIVRPMWGLRVRVEGVKTRKGIVLEDIREADTPQNDTDAGD